MRTPYKIQKSDAEHRQAVENWLFGLDLLSETTREKTVTAWVSAWTSSSHKRLEDMPYTKTVKYRLFDHVNEVTRVGLDLAERAHTEWGTPINHEMLVPILILHDLDKPLIYGYNNGVVEKMPLWKELPHGVIGGMMLQELGFPLEVVSAVAMHSTLAEFHASTFEAYILHYADLFAADHAFITGGGFPIYQMHLSKP
jgi:hypothetical protein